MALKKNLRDYIKEARDLADKEFQQIDWTARDILTNPDVAAEAMYLLSQSDEFAPYIIGTKAKKRVAKAAAEGKDEPKGIRTDKDSYKAIYSHRKKIKSFAATEDNDDYSDFWQEMLALQDAYFIKAAMDAYKIDPSMVDHVNEMRQVKLEEKLKKQEEKAAKAADKSE